MNQGGLWAGAPYGDDNQQVIDVDHAVIVLITGTALRCTAGRDDLLQILDLGLLLNM